MCIERAAMVLCILAGMPAAAQTVPPPAADVAATKAPAAGSAAVPVPTPPVQSPSTPATPPLRPTLGDRVDRPAVIKAEETKAAKAAAEAAARGPFFPGAIPGAMGLDEPSVTEIFGRTGQLSAVVVMGGKEYTVNQRRPTLGGGWTLASITPDGVVIRKGKQTRNLVFARAAAVRGMAQPFLPVAIPR